MTRRFKAMMQINKKDIEMNPFVQSFVTNITLGAINCLKGVDYLRIVELHVDRGDVEIIINGEEVELTPFPNDIIANTIKGLIIPLKGIDEVKTIDIQLDAE